MLDPMQSPHPMIGTDEVAAIFGVDRSTVTRWVQSGKLEAAVQTRSILLFDRAAVEQIAGAS